MLHTYLTKYLWSTGLIAPYSEVVQRVDPAKDIDDMVDAVQREAFRRLHRNNYENVEDAMKAFAGKQSANGAKKTAGKVNEVDSDADEEEGAAAGTGNAGNKNGRKNKQCTYCNRFGHVVWNCKTKARDKRTI